MNNSTACLPRTISLSRPWPLRWLDAAADRVAVAASFIARIRRPRGAQWDAGAASQFSDHVLRDIGVPDWVRAEAAARREAEQFGLAALRGRSGVFDRGF